MRTYRSEKEGHELKREVFGEALLVSFGVLFQTRARAKKSEVSRRAFLQANPKTSGCDAGSELSFRPVAVLGCELASPSEVCKHI